VTSWSPTAGPGWLPHDSGTTIKEGTVARGDKGFGRRKAATGKAARIEAEAQEELRAKHEKGKPPRMSRADVARARRMDEDYPPSVKPKKRFGK
jgi:hypothetical protein